LRRDPDERITSEDVLYHPWLKQDDEHREIINTKSSPSTNDDQCVPEWYSNDSYDADTDMMGHSDASMAAASASAAMSANSGNEFDMMN
jgi:serine/threonine protein kinase